jgi:hypothetical protein
MDLSILMPLLFDSRPIYEVSEPRFKVLDCWKDLYLGLIGWHISISPLFFDVRRNDL